MNKEVVFLRTPQSAKVLGVSPRSLEKWRLEGRGPQFRRHGRVVVYSLKDLLSWSDGRVHCSTSDTEREGQW